MKGTEVSEKTLPQISTVFQGLLGIFMRQSEIHPHLSPPPSRGRKLYGTLLSLSRVRPEGSGQDSPLPRLRGMGGEKVEGDRKNATTQIPSNSFLLTLEDISGNSLL